MGASRNRRYDAFLGEAPPEKVVDAVRSLRKRNWNRAEIEADHGRNTCYALVKLGLISTDGVAAADISSAPPEEIVALRARSSPTVLFVIGLLRRNRQMTGLDVGHAVARRFSMQWSEGSRKRNGGALKLWAEWAR